MTYSKKEAFSKALFVDDSNRLESSINKAFKKASFLLSKTKLLAHAEALLTVCTSIHSHPLGRFHMARIVIGWIFLFIGLL